MFIRVATLTAVVFRNFPLFSATVIFRFQRSGVTENREGATGDRPGFLGFLALLSRQMRMLRIKS